MSLETACQQNCDRKQNDFNNKFSMENSCNKYGRDHNRIYSRNIWLVSVVKNLKTIVKSQKDREIFIVPSVIDQTKNYFHHINGSFEVFAHQFQIHTHTHTQLRFFVKCKTFKIQFLIGKTIELEYYIIYFIQRKKFLTFLANISSETFSNSLCTLIKQLSGKTNRYGCVCDINLMLNFLGFYPVEYCSSFDSVFFSYLLTLYEHSETNLWKLFLFKKV